MALTIISRNNDKFSNIARGKIKCDLIYQDDQCVAFNEENPQAPTHFVIVPKKVVPMLNGNIEEHEKAIGHLLLIAGRLASEHGLSATGYHVVAENNYIREKCGLRALHVFGRALHHMLWPVGPGSRL